MMSKDLRKAADLLQQSVIRSCPSLHRAPGLKLEHGAECFVISYKGVDVRAPYPPRGDEPATHAILERCGHELALRVESAYGPEDVNQLWQAWQSIRWSIVGQRP